MQLRGTACAVKQANCTTNAKLALAREREALKVCVHPNIIELKDEVDDGRLLVLELCTGGTVEDRLQATRGKRAKSRGKSRRQPMPVRRVVQVAVELMRAVNCMHEQGYCHGDIKCANILLATKAFSSHDAGVKLADMGFSRKIGSNLSEMDGGSTPFIAPELQLGLEGIAKPAQDIFACGVVMLDLACTEKPYESLSVREFDAAVQQGTLYSRGSVPLADFKNNTAFTEFADVFFDMISHDPDGRPTAAQAVSRLEAIAKALDGQKEAARATSPCGARAIVAATAFNGACMNGEAERTAGAPDLVTPLPESDAVASAVVHGDIAADDVVAAHGLCDGGIWGNTNIGDLGMPEGAVAAVKGDFEMPPQPRASASCERQAEAEGVACASQRHGTLWYGQEACTTAAAAVCEDLLQEFRQQYLMRRADGGGMMHQEECQHRHKDESCECVDHNERINAGWSGMAEVMNGGVPSDSGPPGVPSPQWGAPPSSEHSDIARQSVVVLEKPGVEQMPWPELPPVPVSLASWGGGCAGQAGGVDWQSMHVSSWGEVSPVQPQYGASHATWGDCSGGGWPYYEVQSTVQPGWAPSRLDDISPRNAISEPYGYCQPKERAGRKRMEHLGFCPSSKKSGHIQEDTDAVWSPW